MTPGIKRMIARLTGSPVILPYQSMDCGGKLASDELALLFVVYAFAQQKREPYLGAISLTLQGDYGLLVGDRIIHDNLAKSLAGKNLLTLEEMQPDKAHFTKLHLTEAGKECMEEIARNNHIRLADYFLPAENYAHTPVTAR